MTQPELLLIHGWGFGPGLWHPFIRKMKGWTCHCPNLGFFGRASPAPVTNQPVIAIGHSLGFLWLLKQQHNRGFFTHCQGLVSINGFSRFSQNTDFPHGVSTTLLEQLTNRVTQEPATVLRLLNRQSGWLSRSRTTNTRGTNRAALKKGLQWLTHWDERPGLATLPFPVLALASRDDRIVTPAMSQTCFEKQKIPIQWLDTGGHITPLTRPAACATHIRTFLDTLL